MIQPLTIHQKDRNNRKKVLKMPLILNRSIDNDYFEHSTHRRGLIICYTGPKLRPRCAKAQTTDDNILKDRKKLKQLVKRQPKIKSELCDSIEIGKVVLCKMRGYSAWPAVVTGIDGNLIKVEFFGDHTTYTSAKSNFFKFECSHDLILSNLRALKSPLYRKAVCEAESLLGIPPDQSILNRI